VPVRERGNYGDRRGETAKKTDGGLHGGRGGSIRSGREDNSVHAVDDVPESTAKTFLKKIGNPLGFHPTEEGGSLPQLSVGEGLLLYWGDL